MLISFPPLIEEGSISERLIDEAVWRVLTLKNDLGLFENPYRGADLDEEKYFATIEHRELARKVASESLVLLKNKKDS